jgi:uncharacterized membrane protein
MDVAAAGGASWALFFHLLGAFCFVGGAVVATVAYEAARRRERPGEIAAFLSLTRVGVALVGAGGLLVLAMGLALVELNHLSYGDAWIAAALALFAVAAVLGAVGGQTPKHARRLAERLAREDDASTPELRRLLDDRVARIVNYASGAAVLAILVLMVWKPS